MAALTVHPPNINSHAEFVDVATTSPGNTEVNPSPNVYANANNFNPSPIPSQDSLSTKIKTRKANRIYFIFYFFYGCLLVNYGYCHLFYSIKYGLRLV